MAAFDNLIQYIYMMGNQSKKNKNGSLGNQKED